MVNSFERTSYFNLSGCLRGVLDGATMSFLRPDFFDRLYQGRSFERSLDTKSLEVLAHRICPLGQHATGFEDVYAADGRLLVTVRKLRARQTFHDRSIGLGRLVVVFHMAGQRTIKLGSGPPVVFEGSRLGAYFHACGQQMQTTWSTGSHERSVIVGSWPEELAAIIGNRFKTLRDILVVDDLDRILKMPMPARIRSAVEDIVSPRLPQDLMPHFLRAKAQEAFCLAVEALMREFGEPGQKDEVERHAVLGLLAQIDAALQDPLDSGYLARSVGMTKREFSKLFKAVTGRTYPEYISMRRLARSRHLIETTDLPLKQIAHAVGYRHVSNLSLSISRAFGMSPKKLRATAIKQNHCFSPFAFGRITTDV